MSDSLVALSRADKKLREQKKLPEVENFFSLYLEPFVRVKPTHTLLLQGQRAALTQLEKLQTPYTSFSHNSVTGIHHSIRTIGKLCGRESKASALDKRLLQEVASVQERHLLSQKRIRPLVIIGGMQSAGGVKKLFVSGSDGFYYELLQKLGVTPAYKEQTRSTSAFPLEEFFSFQPTHIIHILSPNAAPLSRSELKKLWKDFSDLPAVKNGELFSRSESYFSIPGISYPRVMKNFAAMLFAESDEEE